MRSDGRRVLLGASTLLAGLSGLAGCMGGSGDSEPGIPVEPDHKGWFDGVSNYRDTKDRRNADAVTVEVGVEANSGYLGFGPAAAAVTPNTTVTWEWTGRGGDHNVVSPTDLFDSGETVDDGDATFAYTFDQPGVFRYSVNRTPTSACVAPCSSP